jgi:hypothetical protein
MNRKAFGILFLAACLFIVLAIVGQNRVGTGPIAGDSAGTQLLAGLSDNLNGISRVAITGAGGQQLVGLERVDDQWTVSETGGYPAERSKINALLIALAEARIVEEKTSNPELHSRLGVEDIEDPEATGLEVSLIDANGEAFEVMLGDTYTSGQVYARIADNDQSVLIDRNPEIARDPGDWVVTDIINVASDRVQRVEITQANEAKLVIRKDAPGTGDFIVDGIPEGRELQYAGVANVTAGLLQNLRLDDVQPATDELTGPVVISEFWMFDGLVVTVATTGVGDDAWLTFDARFEPDHALSFAGAQAAGDLGAAESSDEPDEAGADPASPADSARAEAEIINGRLADWRYRIPSYQLSQLTRRIEDLLKPQTTE